MDPSCILPWIFFGVALVFGFLTLVAKEVWRDKNKTQFFAVIAIIGTVCLMAWAFIYLP